MERESISNCAVEEEKVGMGRGICDGCSVEEYDKVKKATEMEAKRNGRMMEDLSKNYLIASNIMMYVCGPFTVTR